MREIIVFRHNLFRVSEPFIAQQAETLIRHRPLYLGRLRFGDPPAGAASLALTDLGSGRRFLRTGWQMISRRPDMYLRLLGDRKPLLIHAHFGVEGVYALPLAKRLKIPLITTFHGFDATLSTAALLASPAWASYALFRRRLARRGDLFLCASSFIRERVIALGFPKERTKTHYIGVDRQAIPPRKPDEETSTILHVARLVDVKGTEYLIRAFGILAARRSDIELTIIGDGPLRRPLQALAKSIGLEGRVRFLGAQPHRDVLAWMRKAAMLVQPSVQTSSGRVEGLGMVLLEAAAAGVPLIGSNLGGIPEIVIDGRTGFLTPPRDAQMLARRMDDLLNDSETRRRMSAEARALVARQFDIHRQTEALETLYDEVLATRNA